MEKIFVVMALVFTIGSAGLANAHTRDGDITHLNQSGLCVSLSSHINFDTTMNNKRGAQVRAGFDMWDNRQSNGQNLSCWTEVSAHVTLGERVNFLNLGDNGAGGVNFIMSSHAFSGDHWHIEHIHLFFNSFFEPNWSDAFMQRLAAHERGHSFGYGYTTGS